MLIDSVYIKYKNYYPQVFLERYKHVVKKKEQSYFFTENKEIYSDDSDEETQMKTIKYTISFLKETRIK